MSQALPAAKQLNLNKLGDADRSQKLRLTTQPKTNFSSCLGILLIGECVDAGEMTEFKEFERSSPSRRKMGKFVGKVHVLASCGVSVGDGWMRYCPRPIVAAFPAKVHCPSQR